MWTPRPLSVLLNLLGLLCSLLFAACGAGMIQTSDAGVHGSATPSDLTPRAIDHAVPPLVLHNPAPGALDVLVSVNMPGEGAERGKTIIGLSFLSHGTPVQILGNAQLLCNGTQLPIQHHAALFQLADAPTATLAGTTLSCTYQVGDTSTRFSFVVPSAPVFRSPKAEAPVSRSSQMVVAYKYDAQAGMLMGLVALGSGAKTVADHLNVPALGLATLDTSRFPPGSGSLALTQALAPRITWSGTLFRSLAGAGTATAQISVIWV